MNRTKAMVVLAAGIWLLGACAIRDPMMTGGAGYVDGDSKSARFYFPLGVALDPSGNVYVADSGNNLIRKITPNGTVSTFAGGGAVGATASGSSDGLGTAALFWSPSNIAADNAGNLYVVDAANELIRKITPDGTVTTLAGGGSPGGTAAGYANGLGQAAKFNFGGLIPGIAVDAAGTVFVADAENKAVRTITPDGLVGTLAGGPNQTTFDAINGVGVDGSGNVYVVDIGRRLMYKVTPQGTVSPLAGGGPGYKTNGLGSQASLNQPRGVAVDGSGNLFFVDSILIRKITPEGRVSFIAGGAYETGADGVGSDAGFFEPEGIAVDQSGNLYVADTNDASIRKISPSHRVTTFAGPRLY